MIAAPVRVISTDEGVAQVEPAAQSGCSGCQSRSSCGLAGLGKYFSHNRKAIAMKCEADVQAGDELQLILSEGDLLKAGLLAYLLPSVLALIGAGVAASWGDAAAALGAGIGMAAGMLLGRLSGWAPRMSVKTGSQDAL